jgi:hypothetical protein
MSEQVTWRRPGQPLVRDPEESLRLLFPQELVAYLESAGFEDVCLRGGFGLDPRSHLEVGVSSRLLVARPTGSDGQSDEIIRWRATAIPHARVHSNRREQSQESTQHVEVIVEELRLHGSQLGNWHPTRQGGVIVAAHFRQFSIAEVEVMGMRDGAAALAAVGMIEHSHAAQ